MAKFNPQQTFKIFEKLTKTLNQINSLTIGKTLDQLSWFKKIKLFYLIKFKFPLIRRTLRNRMILNLDYVINHPDVFVDLLSMYVCIVDTLQDGYEVNNGRTFLDDMFHLQNLPNPIEISFQGTKDHIIGYKLNIRLPSMMNEFYYRKAMRIKLDIDTEHARYNAETSVYDYQPKDTDKLGYLPHDAKLEYHKLFQIQPDGKLYNPNYVFDSSVKDQDLKDYLLTILHALAPFHALFTIITSIQFVSVKLDTKS